MSSFYRPMELDIWSPDWHLPSVDIDCLYILAYAQFSNVKLNVHYTNNPFKSNSGTLPVFRHYKKRISDLNQVVDYFKSKGHDADGALSSQEKSEIIAYETMLKEKLYPAIQYLFWVDDINRMEVIRPWYWKHIPFPIHFFYPGKFERKARHLISVLYPDVEEEKLKATYILADAENCINNLSSRLEKIQGPYFFGKEPSSLDALVFAYLGPLLKAPLKNCSLQNHVKNCTNLNRFILSICQNNFKNTFLDSEQKRKRQEKENAEKEKGQDPDFPHSLKRTILATLFVTLSMGGYAIYIGLFNVPIKTN